MTVREKDPLTELKFNGCKVECFDRLVVVHYVMVIPWEKVEHMTLLPSAEVGVRRPRRKK
jgi:hypothetical protein